LWGNHNRDYIPHKLYVEFFNEQVQPIEAMLGILPDDISLLRNKLIHNDIPFNDYLKNKVSGTPVEVVRGIIDHSIQLYDDLIGRVDQQP
jgi:hypothetical protein